MNTTTVSIGLVLVGVALHATALTIGPAKGAAWIGRPLELSVPVVRDTLSDTATLCAHANIFYAETQQESERIQIVQESTEQADTVRLRLRSSTLVDEPVVTITLRVGCEDSYVRRFVLLADLPPTFDPTPDGDAAAAPVPLSPPSPTGASTNPLAPITSAPASTPKRKVAARASAPRATTPKVTPATSALTDKPTRTRGARLQLDPLEVLVERVKSLEIATATPPVETVSKETELLLRMESDLQSLRQQTAKNEATLLALQKRLEQAESDRVSAELFYGLLAVVVVCASAIVALWHRRRIPVAVQEQPSPEEPEPYEAQFLRKTLDVEAFEPPPAQMPVPTDAPLPGTQPVDVNLVEFEEPPVAETSARVAYGLNRYTFNSS